MTDYKDQQNSFQANLQSPIKSQVNLHSQDQSNHVNSLDNPQNSQSNIQDYRFEATRLESYKNWPIRFIEPAVLASAGFFYTGREDYVRCFECGIELGRWVEGDDPQSDHQHWQSNCRFVRQQPCGNVPIGVDPITVPPAGPRTRDVCGHYGEEIRSDSSPDFRIDTQKSGGPQLGFPSSAKLGSLGLATQKGPAHPEYASYDARLRTFEAWPKFMIQTKEQLADAGFYYTGTGDQTLCYHCGGGLKDWEPEDDPWVQHAKWFKKCYYVLMVKGQAFVNNVIGQPVNPPTREETLKMNLPSFIKKIEPAPNVQDNKVPDETPTIKSATCKSSDDARICKICYNEELGVVFLPCGHMVACTKCAPGMTTCAVCREPVSMTVRAIIS